MGWMLTVPKEIYEIYNSLYVIIALFTAIIALFVLFVIRHEISNTFSNRQKGKDRGDTNAS